MRFSARLRGWIFDTPLPISKQIPLAVLFLIILIVNARDPGSVVKDPPAVIGSGLLVLAATLLALFLSLRPQHVRFAQIVPGLDFVAIALLLVDTPVGHSAYAVLVVLPIVWMAAENGRRFVVYSILGTAIVVVLPLLSGTVVASGVGGVVRLVFEGVVFVVLAVIVNEFSRQARLRTVALQELAGKTAQALAKSDDNAHRLAVSESRLQSTNDSYRQLWEAVTEQSVIGTDMLGRIDAWNPGAEKLLGYSEEQVQGHRIVEFHLQAEVQSRIEELDLHGTDESVAFAALTAPDMSEASDPRGWTYVRADGTGIPVETSVTIRRDPSGQPVGYLFVAHDVSRAREINRLKDEFIGLVSHELRTPLSSILGYVELLRDEDDGPVDDTTRMQYFDVIERNGHRLLTLVGDLLLTAQIESGAVPLDIEKVQVAPILFASIESAKPKVEAGDITVQTNVQPGLVVRADALRLSQAIDNLISNAIKFTPRSGTVAVTAVGDLSAVRISISDTGIGIPAAEVDQLFGRFFRASTATQHAVQGIGLGLTITRAIIAALGGTIDVASVEGRGTTFTITMPRVAQFAQVGLEP